MAIRNIRKNPDPVLRKKSRTVEVFDWRLWQLLDDMAETMYASDGVGLAAVQVGILRRIVVIDIGDGIIELINPEIIETSGEQYELEGCLSFPGEYGMVKRPMNVTVKAKNRHGEDVEYHGEELLAKAFCHEIDHLDGNLFVDHCDKIMDEKELQEYFREQRKQKQQNQQ